MCHICNYECLPCSQGVLSACISLQATSRDCTTHRVSTGTPPPSHYPLPPIVSFSQSCALHHSLNCRRGCYIPYQPSKAFNVWQDQFLNPGLKMNMPTICCAGGWVAYRRGAANCSKVDSVRTSQAGAFRYTSTQQTFLADFLGSRDICNG